MIPLVNLPTREQNSIRFRYAVSVDIATNHPHKAGRYGELRLEIILGGPSLQNPTSSCICIRSTLHVKGYARHLQHQHLLRAGRTSPYIQSSHKKLQPYVQAASPSIATARLSACSRLTGSRSRRMNCRLLHLGNRWIALLQFEHIGRDPMPLSKPRATP